ncbi:MAG TPA: FtsX-like permease family protein [Candidatus Sulfotelmatobacter sp.]|nr:FtsX-like permease family protein [Candidatus Sulfotelmatobacter sp.]
MRAYDLIELAGRNLREAGLRNSLTTLGIGVGVASLVAFLSLGVGLQRLATRQLGRSGLFDTIIVTSRQDGRGPRFAQAAPVVTQPKSLDEAARHSFEQMANVAEVYPNFSAVADIRLESATGDGHFSVVGTLPPSARNSEAFDEVQGGFFSARDAQEAIILADFGRELIGAPPEPRNSDIKLTNEQAGQLLGKYLTLRYHTRERIDATVQASKAAKKKPEPDPDDIDDGTTSQAVEDMQSFNLVPRQIRLKIVGIVNSEPNRGFRQGRTPLFLPLAVAESLNMVQAGELWNTLRPSATKTYIALMVRVGQSKAVAQVEDEIRKQGFNTFSIVDASKGITRFFKFLDAFLAIFGSMALTVASLGIVNTLVMAILERRREIGIMKALGASDGDVKRIFFVEAACMGLLGGMLGAGLGWLIGRAINLVTNIWLQRQDLRPENFWYVSWPLVAWVLVFSVGVSLFAGLYPASRAARLDPVQALRHD